MEERAKETIETKLEKFEAIKSTSFPTQFMEERRNRFAIANGWDLEKVSKELGEHLVSNNTTIRISLLGLELSLPAEGKLKNDYYVGKEISSIRRITSVKKTAESNAKHNYVLIINKKGNTNPNSIIVVPLSHSDRHGLVFDAHDDRNFNIFQDKKLLDNLLKDGTVSSILQKLYS